MNPVTKYDGNGRVREKRKKLISRKNRSEGKSRKIILNKIS